MLAALGACLTMAGACGAGVCLCLERKERADCLHELSQAFSLIAGEISYGGISLPEVLAEIGPRIGGRIGQALLSAGERLMDGSGQGIEQVWVEELGPFLRESSLKKQERELVASFPERVWFLDGQRQQTAVEDFSKALESVRRAALLKASEENRVTMALSLAGGAFAAILFLL